MCLATQFLLPLSDILPLEICCSMGSTGVSLNLYLKFKDHMDSTRSHHHFSVNSYAIFFPHFNEDSIGQSILLPRKIWKRGYKVRKSEGAKGLRFCRDTIPYKLRCWFPIAVS